MSNDVIKVMGYLRVSSEQQAISWNGLSWQRWAIIEMANKSWFSIYKFYEDWGVSGKYMSRKGLDEMLKDLKALNKNPKNPEIKYVMVDDIDRMARDIQVWFTKKWEILATWAKILSLKQNLDDSPEAHLMESISMATKQYERENNGRRVRDRQRQRMLDGYRCFKVPLGYTYWKASDGHWRVVVEDEKMFPAISQWLKQLADGTLPSQESFRKFLIRNWIKTRAWMKLQKSLISNLLKKDNLIFYAGFINYPKRGIDMAKWKHKAAITESEFYQLCNKFRFDWFYKEYSRDDISAQLPLRQVIRCGYCGHPMSWGPAKWHWWQYFYYTCFNKKCSHCKKSYNSIKVHKQVEELLDAMQLDDKYMSGIEVVLNGIRQEKWRLKAELVKDKANRLDELNKKIDSIIDKITETDNPLVSKKLEEKLVELTDEKALLDEYIATNSEEQEEEDFIEHFEHLKSIIQTPLAVWNVWNIELKRMLINVIFSDWLSFTKEDGIQTSKIPLIYAKKLLFTVDTNSILKKSIQTLNTLYENYDYSISNWMVGDIGLEPMTPCL